MILSFFKSIFNGIGFAIGRLITFLALSLLAIFLLSSKVNAQVYVRTDSPADMKTFKIDSSIKNVFSAWGAGTLNTYGTDFNPWIWDVGTTGTINNQYGSFINVDAEYYVGLAYLMGANKYLNPYIESARNTLKSENLRCGFGGYADGYDNSFTPNVYLDVEFTSGGNPSGTYNHELIKIKFKYTQQIQFKSYSGSVSCWFERQPSDGLAFQFINGDYTDYEFYTYTEKFNYELSKSQDTILLEQIEDSNQQIIQNQQQTNTILDGIKDSLLDDNLNDNQINDTLNGLNKPETSLTPFSDFVNLPLNWIQNLLSSSNACQPINLPLPFVNKNLTLPCMTEFWNALGGLKYLIEIVWIAVVGVRIFNGLFLLTCETLDPNPDKDMTKLKSWEL